MNLNMAPPRPLHVNELPAFYQENHQLKISVKELTGKYSKLMEQNKVHSQTLQYKNNKLKKLKKENDDLEKKLTEEKKKYEQKNEEKDDLEKKLTEEKKKYEQKLKEKGGKRVTFEVDEHLDDKEEKFPSTLVMNGQNLNNVVMMTEVDDILDLLLKRDTNSPTYDFETSPIDKIRIIKTMVKSLVYK